MLGAKAKVSRKPRRHSETGRIINRSRARETKAGERMPWAKARISRKSGRHSGTGQQIHRSRAAEIKAGEHYDGGKGESPAQIEASQRDWATH